VTYDPVSSPGQFAALAGVRRGPTDWLRIEQPAVDDFARLTHDPQWIHVDVARAALSPFGGTVVHGYFTLSLVAHWLGELFPITGDVVSINYGLDRVRFPSPVRVGSRLRMSALLASCETLPAGVRVTFEAEVEPEHATKPACVARPVILFTPRG
jgi:acyl dehydratase